MAGWDYGPGSGRCRSPTALPLSPWTRQEASARSPRRPCGAITSTGQDVARRASGRDPRPTEHRGSGLGRRCRRPSSPGHASGNAARWRPTCPWRTPQARPHTRPSGFQETRRVFFFRRSPWTRFPRPTLQARGPGYRMACRLGDGTGRERPRPRWPSSAARLAPCPGQWRPASRRSRRSSPGRRWRSSAAASTGPPAPHA